MTDFMPDLELREKVFRKMGWEVKFSHNSTEGYEYYRWIKDGKILNDIVFHEGDQGDEVVLPPIETDWQITAKYLVPFMRDMEAGWYIREKNQWGHFFCWAKVGFQPRGTAKIIEANIPRAACEAFLEVKLD